MRCCKYNKSPRKQYAFKMFSGNCLCLIKAASVTHSSYTHEGNKHPALLTRGKGERPHDLHSHSLLKANATRMKPAPVQSCSHHGKGVQGHSAEKQRELNMKNTCYPTFGKSPFLPRKFWYLSIFNKGKMIHEKHH